MLPDRYQPATSDTSGDQVMAVSLPMLESPL
jgi:hypothetical protein